MPIVEADPWRLQYFENVACPTEIVIPTDDPEAYALYPQERWIYNKLEIAESQGLACGPHGVRPTDFPVFSKPIFNLRGMGAGSCVLHDEQQYESQLTPGHLWMTLLHGEHVSSDVAVLEGQTQWFAHARGVTAGGGTFDYWVIERAARAGLESYCHDWIAWHLPRYTGMLNIETIGNRIIEVHLRFTDQWPDLYGAGWLEAVVGLYARKAWTFADSRRRDGFSAVLFGPHGRRYRHPSATIVDALRRRDLVTSLQITFHEDRPPAAHSMPPGGFRLAVVNSWSLAAARSVREALAAELLRTDERHVPC